MINRRNYYQYQPPVAMFSIADFGLYDWVGKKGGDFLEWHVNSFDKKSQKYYNDPGFKSETDDTINRINQLRNDPAYNRRFGARVTKGLGATALGLGAIGAGAYFLRRRKTKKGEQIIERVRR